MRLTTTKRLHFQFDEGPALTLVPDAPVDVPALIAEKLLALAPAYIQVVPEREVPQSRRDHDRSAPLKPGWFISYRREGQLVGGPQEGDVGRVWKCVRDANRRLRVYTHAGLAVEEGAIEGVTEVNHDGNLVGAWSVSAHGLDGQREQDDPLPSLAAQGLPSYVPDINVCFSCRGRRFWTSIHGATGICAQCHPPVDASVVAMWTDGPGTISDEVIDCRRREFRDLDDAQQQAMQTAFTLSDAEFDALTTGIWDAATWESFWQRGKV